MTRTFDTLTRESNMGRGGKRAGSGLPRGYKFPKTLEKEAAREFVRTLITSGLKPLIQSQMVHALGIGHVYTRDKKGKFSKIEDQDHIDRLVTEGTEGTDFWLFSKDPSAQSFKELIVYALDKPKEQVQEVHVSGSVELVGRLSGARQRLQIEE
jgi:hypothetical protein